MYNLNDLYSTRNIHMKHTKDMKHEKCIGEGSKNRKIKSNQGKIARLVSPASNVGWSTVFRYFGRCLRGSRATEQRAEGMVRRGAVK